MSKASDEDLLKPLVVNKYRDAFKRLGIPQNYPFLSSGYCEELCIFIRDLKEKAEKSQLPKAHPSNNPIPLSKELSEELSKQQKEIRKWTSLGHSVWIEDGRVCHSPEVPKELFGSHRYSKYGTSDCSHGCGCWAGDSRSGGPVNPFGPCPKNPKNS